MARMGLSLFVLRLSWGEEPRMGADGHGWGLISPGERGLWVDRRHHPTCLASVGTRNPVVSGRLMIRRPN